MQEIKIKTRLEHLITLRNAVAARVAEWEATVMYWQFVSKKAKKKTDKKLEAENFIASNAQNVKKDTLYLKCIDILIEEQKAKNAKT